MGRPAGSAGLCRRHWVSPGCTLDERRSPEHDVVSAPAVSAHRRSPESAQRRSCEMGGPCGQRQQRSNSGPPRALERSPCMIPPVSARLFRKIPFPPSAPPGEKPVRVQRAVWIASALAARHVCRNGPFKDSIWRGPQAGAPLQSSWFFAFGRTGSPVFGDTAGLPCHRRTSQAIRAALQCASGSL